MNKIEIDVEIKRKKKEEVEERRRKERKKPRLKKFHFEILKIEHFDLMLLILLW